MKMTNRPDSDIRRGGRHAVTHRRAPARWEDGFPLGNGRLGVMLWGDGSPLRLTLDHAELWDLRGNMEFAEHPDFNYAGLRRLVGAGKFDEAGHVFEQRFLADNPVGPTKISIGRAELDLGAAVEYDVSLDLDRARASGFLRTAAAAHRVEAFVHHDRNVFCLRVTAPPSDARLRVIPLAEMCGGLGKLGHPKPEMREDEGICTLTQQIPGGPCYALAWNGAGPDFYMAVEVGGTGDDAAAVTSRARATWRRAAAVGLAALRREHVKAWRTFWSASAVHLPEPRFEFLWRFGIYLLAASARRGSTPPGLQGVWAMDGVMPPWRGDYHADMNVQETFWPAGATGHLDLLDSWCDLMKADLPRVREFTRRFFGTEGTFWLSCFLPRYTFVHGWYTVQFAWSHSGWLAWLVWLRWRYSIDRRWLAGTGYELVAEVFRFYRANLELGEDGCLHVPLSTSPEYRENKPAAWARDPNIDLALIRRVCDWLIEMEAALGIDSLSAAARDVRARLAPYALTDAGVLCLWPGKSLDESHRHPSHLMAIHPAMDLTMAGDKATRTIIKSSVRQFLALGQYGWAGHTYAQWTSLAAALGRAGMAYESLRQFADHWIGPSGLHFNLDQHASGMSSFSGSPDGVQRAYGPFTMEANCGIGMGICDMLLQGWGDVVRVFPAVPEHWRDVAFRDLVAEGAFRVSAARLRGMTQWVRIAAGASRRLRLRDPFGGAPFTARGAVVRRDGNDLVGELRRGQTLILARRGARPSLKAAIRAVRASDIAQLGLRG